MQDSKTRLGSVETCDSVLKQIHGLGVRRRRRRDQRREVLVVHEERVLDDHLFSGGGSHARTLVNRVVAAVFFFRLSRLVRVVVFRAYQVVRHLHVGRRTGHLLWNRPQVRTQLHDLRGRGVATARIGIGRRRVFVGLSVGCHFPQNQLSVEKWLTLKIMRVFFRSSLKKKSYSPISRFHG